MLSEGSTLDALFTNARSQNGWLPHAVGERQLAQIYELAKMGPTSLNCQPMRVIFAVSRAAKESLAAVVGVTNREKTLAAPVVAIFGYSLTFPELIPRLFPQNPRLARMFDGRPGLVRDTALRNGTLQAAYFMLAARGLGLDCAPMSGFDSEKVKGIFFQDEHVEVNFICGIGIGDPNKVGPRGPRLSFEEACRLA